MHDLTNRVFGARCRLLMVLAGLTMVVLSPLRAQGTARVRVESQASVRTAAQSGGVRAGDVVRVWIWREKELSGEFPVDARGRVVLPLVGDRLVAGESADALSDSLKVAFRRFLTNPSIDVTILRRISVQGQVAKPGFYPVDATVSIAEVIALAGGIGASGDASKVRVRRNGQTLVTRIGADARIEDSPLQSGDEIFIPERSFLARNGVTLLWIAASSAATLLVTAVTR